MHALEERFEAGGAIVGGILSGTSADGIDVALTRMRTEGARGEARALAAPELLAFETRPFPGDLGGRVRAVLDGAPPDSIGLRECALLGRDLGRAFGAAAREVAERHGVAFDLVGSHGQTVWHHDGAEPSGAATLQLGDGDFVAEEAGCAVVSDFRQRDVAAGGEGAPISALTDDLLFAAAPRPCAVLNLGGMANVTFLGPRGSPVLAFDTGPANSLLDGLARRVLGASCDRDGACASRGRPAAQLVDELFLHPYFAKPPPKSTGRDTFGEAWIDSVIARARAFGVMRAEDLLASAVELVATSVATALERFVTARPEALIVAGGGIHNRALVVALERCTARAALRSDVFGVPADAREALAFAVLAARCVLGIAATEPGATGAARGRVLGKISPARPPSAAAS